MEEVIKRLETMREELFDSKLVWQSLDFKKGYLQAINDVLKFVESDRGKVVNAFPPIPPNTNIT